MPVPTLDPPLIGLALVAEGLERPTFATHAGNGSDRLFVLEKRGTIRTITRGHLAPEPFLDISDRVDDGANERGLLGLTFHPQFATSGLFFVTYTAAGGPVVPTRNCSHRSTRMTTPPVAR